VKLLVLGATLLCNSAFATPHHKPDEQAVLAPGYAELTFQAPEPGSYQLPSLGKASDGVVLTSRGEVSRLQELTGDKFVLLSFIYTSCNDVNGCPLASYVLNKVQRRLQQDAALADYVRLLSISFDRVNDSPDILAKYADNFRNGDFDWQFLTTPSDADLTKILEAYNQFVIEDLNDAGEKIGTLSHILRVYLIDQNRDIRNIYSVSFLHPDIIVNDIRTIVSGHWNQARPGASDDNDRQ
jgi:cytochrome c peroxidase